jgi:hypothetical protein
MKTVQLQVSVSLGDDTAKVLAEMFTQSLRQATTNAAATLTKKGKRDSELQSGKWHFQRALLSLPRRLRSHIGR